MGLVTRMTRSLTDSLMSTITTQKPKPSKCAWGSELYLPTEGKILLPFVEKKILMLKDSGLKPIYGKSIWWEKEIAEQLKEVDPTNRILTYHPIYRQQLIAKCMRLCGFKKRGRSTNRPQLILEW